MFRSAALLASIALASCAAPVSPPQTVRSVDLTRYSGKWYEIASYPQWFQRNCVSATAEYGAAADGRITVENTCIRADGSTRSIEGTATPVQGSENAKLLVEFDTWFGAFIPRPERGNYWILHLTPGYRHALVAGPERESLWILARSPEIDRATLDQLKQIAREQGFDPERLKIGAHTRIR